MGTWRNVGLLSEDASQTRFPFHVWPSADQNKHVLEEGDYLKGLGEGWGKMVSLSCPMLCLSVYIYAHIHTYLQKVVGSWRLSSTG